MTGQGDRPGRVERFEDLVAWQRARQLAVAVYGVSRQGMFSRDLGLAGQVQRAAVSVMSIIAEGYERGTRKEYHRFVSMAKASCAEGRSQLYIANDIGYLTPEDFESLLRRTEELGRILGGLRAAPQRQLNQE